MTTAAAPAIRIPRPVTIGLGALVAAGFAAIAGITFITSFAAVSELAIDRGIVREDLGWTIPFGIDGLIVVASAVAWIESLRDGRWHPFPVAVVALSAALSVAANVAHADSANWLSRALAASPPVGLLLSVELAAWTLRRAVRLGALGQPVAVRDRQHDRWRLRTHPDMITDDIGRLTAMADEAADRRRAEADRLAATATPDGEYDAGRLTDAVAARSAANAAASDIEHDGGQRPSTNGSRSHSGRSTVDLTDLWDRLTDIAADPDQPTPTSRRQVADALDVSRHQANRLAASDPERFADLTAT